MNNVRKIISEYGDILKNISWSQVVPISLLPYSKEKIKESIKIILMFLKKRGELTEEIKNHLEVSYMQLSLFVDDNDAKIVEKSFGFVNNIENSSLEEFISNVKNTPLKNDEMAKLIVEKSLRQGEILLKEIKDFQKKLNNYL